MNLVKRGSLRTRASIVRYWSPHASLHLPRERAITEKSGGCKWEVCDVERMLTYKPACRELVSMKSNGWCRPHIKTNTPSCKVKGSVMVRLFAKKGCYADLEVLGVFNGWKIVKGVRGLENRLSSREVKDIRRVVLCSPKGYVATGRALRGRLI